MWSDTVFFREKVAPGNQDWLHCKVLARGNGVIKVKSPTGFGGKPEVLEFPLAQVQRVSYGVDA